MIQVPGCKDLQDALETLKEDLDALYKFIERANMLAKKVDKLQGLITKEPLTVSAKLKNFNYASSVEELREEIEIQKRRLNELDALASEDVQSDVHGYISMVAAAKFDLKEIHFPSHKRFHEVLTQVLNSKETDLETKSYEPPEFAGTGKDFITGSNGVTQNSTGSHLLSNLDVNSGQTGLIPPIQAREVSATLGTNEAKEASVAAIQKATNKLNKGSKSRTSKPKRTQSHARNTSVVSVNSDGSTRSMGDSEQADSEVEAARSTQSPNTEHGGPMPPPPPTGPSVSSTAPEPLR
jgi:hypothetical protein